MSLLLRDLKMHLAEMNEEYPHYIVGERSEKTEDSVRSWIINVYQSWDGEVILQYSDNGLRDKHKAMTVGALCETVLSLSCEQESRVELSCFDSEAVARMDIPIVGGYVDHEKEIFVFAASAR